MTPQYSIIIPVYNSEKTLRRCVDSVLSSDKDNIEVLLINDGSTDGSHIICEDYCRKYPYIHYFEKPNGGVSSARNMGLDHSLGEWIMFLDSDDCYMNNWLDIISRYVSEYSADYYQFSWVKKNNREMISRVSIDQIGNTIEDSARILVKEMRNKHLNVPYAKLFRKKIIDANNIRFHEDLPIGEDMLFVFSYVLNTEKIVTSSSKIYCAFIDNADSLSRKKRENLLDQLLLVDEKALSILNAHDLSSTVRKMYLDTLTWSYYRKAYTVSKELLKFGYTLKERLKKENIICSRFSISRLKSANLKTKMIAIPVVTRMTIIIDILSVYRANNR